MSAYRYEIPHQRKRNQIEPTKPMGSTVFSQFSYICLPFRLQVTLDPTNGSINPYLLVTKHSNGKSPIYFNHFPSLKKCLKNKPPYAIGHEMFQPCAPKDQKVEPFRRLWCLYEAQRAWELHRPLQLLLDGETDGGRARGEMPSASQTWLAGKSWKIH